MSQGRRLMDHQLDRLERTLERCIERDNVSRRRQRAERDVFYEKLKILREMQEETKALVRRLSGSQE